MGGKIRTRLTIFYAGLLIFLLAGGVASAQIQVTESNLGPDNWLNPSDPITIRLNQLPTAEEGRIAIFIGQTDVSALVREQGGQLVYNPKVIPLTAGKQEVGVYFVSPVEEWFEIARLPLNVLNELGFEESTFTPQADVTFNNALNENRTRDAGGPLHDTPYSWGTVQGGFNTELKKNGYTFTGNMKVLGTSLVEERLRFGELGNHASPFDTPEFQFNLNRGNANLTVGHFAFGNNTHLLNQYGSRGVSFSYGLTDWLDVAAAAFSSTQIVGFQNFTGLRDTENIIQAQTIGINLLNGESGLVRTEVTHMNGSLRAQNDFNEGQVLDAEKSDGFGARLIMEGLVDGRFNGNFGFARSEFNNPTDPNLDPQLFTGGLVATTETTDSAYEGDASIAILKGNEIFDDKVISLTAFGRYEQINPLFKSLGSFTNTDFRSRLVGFDLNTLGIGTSYQFVRTRDNLLDVPTILTTRTESHLANLSLPLPSLLGSDGELFEWAPNITYSFSKVNQYGANNPINAFSGFQTSHVPDQLSVSHNFDTTWQMGQTNFGYRFSYNSQDNRQPGRQNSDFKTIVNQLFAGTTLFETLNFNVGFDRTQAVDEENNLDRFTNNVTLDFNYNFLTQWNLSGNYSYTVQEDNFGFNFNEAYTTNTQISYDMEVPFGRFNFPVRLFARHSMQSDFFKDRFFIFETDVRVWTVNTGFSVSLF